MKLLLLVTFIVVATLAINICETNAFPQPKAWREAAKAARETAKKCQRGILRGPECQGINVHMHRSLDRTEGRVMEGKYSMQFWKFESLASPENSQDPST